MKKAISLVIIMLLMITPVFMFAAPALAAEPAAVIEQLDVPIVSQDAVPADPAPNLWATALGYCVKIAATAVITAIGVAGAWLTAKIGQNKNLASIKAATEQVVQAAQITVGELQQTVVEKLKLANGGKLTETQIAELGDALLDKTYDKLSTPALNLLSAAMVDINALIKGVGEDWIQRMKPMAITSGLVASTYSDTSA
jgi:hypothetical protein